jgi:3-keto-L-gulonate-6-phosphate decarboxylase
VAPEVDIIEIGTPLCKAVGLDAIRAMRELVGPDKLILADFKSPDVGGLEAKMAFDAGADMMTVIGGAALATVESALQAAKEARKEMLMELTGVRDILARAKEWRQIGVERMVYHRGWDEETFNRQWGDDDRKTVQALIDMGFKITVTGGINKSMLPFFSSLAVSVVICGRGIRETPDPRQSARFGRYALQGGGGVPSRWQDSQHGGGEHGASAGCERDGADADGGGQLPRLRISQRCAPARNGRFAPQEAPGQVPSLSWCPGVRTGLNA